MSSAEALSGAIAEFSRGNLEEAERLCERMLAAGVRDARAFQLAAAIALKRGDVEAALQRANAAVELDSRSPSALQTRGQVLREQGRAADAERDFLRACELDPGFPDPQASLGALRVTRGALAEARPHLERAVAARPDAVEWRYNLALCDIGEERWDSAQGHLRRVLQARPGWPDALNALGALLTNVGELAEACAVLEAAVRSAPDRAQAWSNLALAQLAQGHADHAVASAERCVLLAPGDPKGWTHLGNALRARGERAAAERAYRDGLARAPGDPFVLQNLGNLLRESGRFEEAIACLEEALGYSQAPELHFSLAIALLSAGRLERGWSEYGWRHGEEPGSLEAVRRTLEEGRGVELQGEQGLGDMLFFLRWTRAAPGTGRFAWRGEPRLLPLLEGTGAAGAAGGAGASMHVGDLPRLFAEESHPPPLALHAAPEQKQAALEALRAFGPPPYLAVAWRAGLPFNAAEERLVKNVPLEELAAALAAWQGTLVSIQRKPRAGELEALRARSGKPVFDAGAYNEDLVRLSGLLAAVDLYAGVSSTNVHIAAGVGLPARILVPYPAEWRYAGSAPASPWFPGFVLHREDPRLGWAGTLAELSCALGEPRGP